MHLNQEVLEQFHQLNDKVKNAEEIASESMRTAQDRFKHRKHKLTREGKEIELTEKTLWDEVFYLGEDSQAGEILKKLHPQVFENYRLQSVAAAEYKKFGITELGVDPSRMTMSDQLKMVEAMVAYKLGHTGSSTWTANPDLKPKESKPMRISVILAVLLAVLTLGYFAPFAVAVDRQRDPGAIFVLNLVFGWTIIGWIIALVWALKK